MYKRTLAAFFFGSLPYFPGLPIFFLHLFSALLLPKFKSGRLHSDYPLSQAASPGPRGRLLYVSSHLDGEIVRYDARRRTYVDNFAVLRTSRFGLAVNGRRVDVIIIDHPFNI